MIRMKNDEEGLRKLTKSSLRKTSEIPSPTLPLGCPPLPTPYNSEAQKIF